MLWTCFGWILIGGVAGVLAWLALGPVDHGDSAVSDPNSLTEFYAVIRPWLLLGPIAAGVALRLTGHRRPWVTTLVLWLVGTIAAVPIAIVVALLVTLKLGGTAAVAFAFLWLVPPPVIARLASTVERRDPNMVPPPSR